MEIFLKKIYILGKQLMNLLFIWIVSALIATSLRFDGSIPDEKYIEIFKLGLLGSVFFIITSRLFNLKNSSEERINTEGVLILCTNVALVTFLLTIIRITYGVPILPRSVPIITGLIALLLKFTFRVIFDQHKYTALFNRSRGENTLIYGAGITGRQLAEQMLLNSDLYKPIGFLDDNAKKQDQRVLGRRVYGGLDQLEKIAETHKLKNLIVAISQIDSVVLSDLEERCRNLQISLKIIPNPFKIILKNLVIEDISNISEEDLLGRRPSKPDELEISKFIHGKKILITGAGGSIGSEIARQVNRFAPSSIYFLDRDETALLKLELDLFGNGLFNDSGFILADIRDQSTIKTIINDIKPDIVFHSAALKHLALLEKFPEESYKTNVLGTKNLVEACLKSGVKYFVNISTDKAADPISNLGKSKLLTERLIASVTTANNKYISVRFGNVIGSNGSFLSTFRHQIESSHPITITHPEITRYFMTIGEAVHLVLQSLIVGECGETLILEMGTPVSINQVATRMIKISGKDIPIKYTGLRSGEKLNEQLVGSTEKVSKGSHKDIMHTRVEPLKEGDL